MDLGELNAGLNALDVAFADRDNNGNFVGLREGSERLPVVTAETNPVTGGVTKIWTGTQAEYDAIATPADDTLYIIVEA